MRIAFYADKSRLVSPNALNEVPLNTIETSLVRLAEVLVRRGHDVTVFSGNVSTVLANPRYLPCAAIGAEAVFDLIVVVKDWRPVLYRLPAKRFFFWADESDDQFFTLGIGDLRCVKAFEKLIAVSNWQANRLAECSGFPREKMHVMGLGLPLSLFEGEEQRNPNRLITFLTPNDALTLIPVLGRLRQRVHEVELQVFYGFMSDGTDGWSGEGLLTEKKRIRQYLGSQPGCVVRGEVLERSRIREMKKATVLLIPYTFVKAVHLNVLEAQAAGCPVVCPSNGALPENVGDAGIIVSDYANAEDFVAAYEAAVNTLLTNRDIWQRCSDRGLAIASSELSWEEVANRFEGYLG